MFKTSSFRVVSIGIVAKNREMNNHTIEVTPIEFTPTVSGELNDEKTLIGSSGLDGNGDPWSVTVDTSKSVPAKWLKSTNRVTPPDVRIGEQVLIWKVGNSPKLYWTSMGRDDNLRRLETIIFQISDVPDGDVDEELTPENTYSLEWSTHDKNVTLRTCKRDNEPFAYTIQLDTKVGRWVVTDDANNFVEMRSDEKRIEMKNGDGTYFKIHEKNIVGYAPDDINLTAEKNIKMVCTDFSLTASESIIMDTKKTKLNSADEIILITKDANINASKSVTVDTPVMTVTGILNVNKSVAVTQGVSAASMKSEGAVEANSVKAKGKVEGDSVEAKSMKADNATFKSHGPH